MTIMMKKISIKDIIPPEEYEKVRDDYRRRIIALKKERRVDVGPKVSFVFENRDTILFQIQEMIRAEHMTDPRKIQDEIDIYTPLIPGPREMSTTMFIEIEDRETIKKELKMFVGIDRTVSLKVGRETIPGIFEEGRSTDDTVSSVQYVRFRLTPHQIAAFKNGGSVALEISHPRYPHSQTLSPLIRKALSTGLE